MMFQILTNATPNQEVFFMRDGDQWQVSIFTRLGKLFASVQKNSVYLVRNRSCIDRVNITNNLVFINIDGALNFDYTTLGASTNLYWMDDDE